MRKFIFLDIDGVLNNTASMANSVYIIPEKASLIQLICILTGAELVLSSTWRMGETLDSIKQYYYKHGIPSNLWAGLTDSRGPQRGDEIERWLKKEAGEHYNYCIVDDDSDMTDEQKDGHFVKPHHFTGLTIKNAIEIVKILHPCNSITNQREHQYYPTWLNQEWHNDPHTIIKLLMSYLDKDVTMYKDSVDGDTTFNEMEACEYADHLGILAVGLGGRRRYSFTDKAKEVLTKADALFRAGYCKLWESNTGKVGYAIEIKGTRYFVYAENLHDLDVRMKRINVEDYEILHHASFDVIDTDIV